MSLTTTTNKQQHTANGSTTAFSFPYKFNANSDLVVVLTNLTTGVSTTQVIVTNYAVTGAGNPAGGTVTFVTAPADALRVTITREVPYTQEVDYQPDDDFPAEVHEAALDKLTMIGQQLDTEFDYALKQPTTDANPIGILPTAAVRANKYLVFDVNGDPQATASTSATSDIVNGSVTPAKLSTGGPNWDASGNVTATSFVGNVTGAGNSTFAGNVGIGTSSPTARLDVRTDATSGVINLGPTTGVTGVVLATTSGMQIGSTNSQPLYFQTNGTVKASIASDGTFNIGGNPITNCPTTAKAWVEFNGVTAGTFAGGASTIFRAAGSTTATITTTNDHGLTNDIVYISATGLVTGYYGITYLTSKTFSIITAATTLINNVAATFAVSPIRSQYNVSSIAKAATGDYYVNFRTPLSNTNYAVCVTGSSTTEGNGYIGYVGDSTASVSGAKYTTAVRVGFTTSAAAANPSSGNVIVFGN